MKLKKILKYVPDIEIKGSKEVEINGVTSNSKLVAPGNLFVARRGGALDGASFIPEALSAGAAAVLTDLYDPSLKSVTQLIYRDVRSVEPLLAALCYEQPSEQLFMVGVTGTSGKTTTTYLVKHLLDGFRGPCGLIGTIEYLIGHHAYRATHTTPDVSTNHKLLREMVNFGGKSTVMEVSSHALDQNRVDQIHYDVAIFTNLTPEHLDYHPSMEAYLQAKNRLFRKLAPSSSKKYPLAAIVNRDDPAHEKILEGCKAPVLGYAIESRADLQAINIQVSTENTRFELLFNNKKYPVETPLVGRYNVYNCLAALACGISQGFDLEKMLMRIKEAPLIPARIEPVPNALGLKIYVDFAHKLDALENVLRTLSEIKTARLLTVFGCGGDRDKSKRPRMAQVSEKYSDHTIVTSDNPRSEEPEQIMREIVAGFSRKNSHTMEVDRRQAIQKAIEMAQPGDIILIAGKGHETTQIFAHQTIRFDDRLVAKEICDAFIQK